MMASKVTPNMCGLIIVGNSGVGKSFLANMILGKHHFKHDFSARSVTHRTESVTCVLGDRHFRIYNIPGLIEGDKDRIVLNRREISRAFEEQQDNPLVIIYVFGHQHGRIRNEDIATFRSIHNAYTLCLDSLITIVNGLPPDRPNTYNEDTQTTMIDLLGMKPGRICFIDRVNSIEAPQGSIQKPLIDAILNVHPRIHTKTNNISLITDDMFRLQADLDMMHIRMENERYEHEETIASMVREYEVVQRMSVLRRLFCQAKVDLRRLITFSEQEEDLINVIAQWEAEEIGYADDPTSDHCMFAVINKQDAEEQLKDTFATQHQINIALDERRKDIEQICYELEQIYDGTFDCEYESVREYYILLDDLRFDPSILNVKHDFINDLCIFTNLRFRHID